MSHTHCMDDTQAAGVDAAYADDETVFAEPIADASHPLAYSDQTTTLPVVEYTAVAAPRHVSWVVIAICGTALLSALVIVFCVGRITGREPHPASAPKVAATASPTPSPTLATTPTPTVDRNKIADDYFVQTIQDPNYYVPITDMEAAKAQAHAVCAYFDAEPRSEHDQYVWSRQMWPDWSATESGYFIGAAMNAYCPKYLPK